MSQVLFQLVRFSIIGVLAVGIDFIVYFGLLYVAPSLPIPISKALSYISGATISFMGHRIFVFNAGERHVRYQILPFIFLYATSLLANNLINQLVLFLVGSKFLAWFIAICTSTSINYLGMKFGVFRKNEQ